MTRRLWLCLWLLSGVALHAQTGTASVSGTVVDDEGKPMRRVSVVFEGDTRTNRTAITDDQGKFNVTGMPAARYTIRAEKGGYPSIAYGAKRPGRPGSGLLVKDGQQVDNILLRMSRGAVITGTVFDDKGRPVPNASVTAYVVQTTIGGDFDIRPVVESGSSFPVTDDRGIYRFYGLAAGEYIVGTSPFFEGLDNAVRVPSDAEIREAFGLSQTRTTRAISTDPKPQARVDRPLSNYAAVYFPDVADPMSATRVKVAPGEERRGVDLHLALQQTATISGEVIGPDPKLPPLEMELARRSGVSGADASLVGMQQSSAFSYPGLAPGDYLVVARSESKPVLWAELPVSLAGRDMTGLRLLLQPAMTAAGRIVFAGTSLPPPSVDGLLVAASAVSTKDHVITGPAEITSGYEFTFSDIVPGRIRIGARVRDTAKPGAPTWTLASVMLGDRDVTDLPVEITAGQSIPPITITFTDNASELQGSLVTADGKPGADYFVVALPSDERYWIWNSRRIKSGRPDASGRYTFSGLPPGTYRVAAVTELDQGDLQNQTFLRDLAANSAEVTIGVGEKKVFDLKLGGG